MASYPTSIFSPAAKNTGDTIQASHVGNLDAEVTAIETGLETGLQHTLTVSTGGLTVSTGSVNIGGPSSLATLSVTGGSTFAGPVVCSSGVTISSGGLTISTGVLTLGQGAIVFPATQVAAAGVNTLDDYEEGTWTPTLAGYTTAGTVTTAKYTKVGDLVACVLAFTGTSNATTLTFTLPFTCGRTLSAICGSVTDNGAAINTPSRCDFVAASATVTVFKSFDGTAFTNSGTKAFSAMFFFHIT